MELCESIGQSKLKKSRVGDCLQIEFEIKHNSKGYIVIRKGGEYRQHSHHKTLRSCHEVIKLISINKLPKSKYLRGSCQRLLTLEEYNQLRPSKQIYININKGVRQIDYKDKRWLRKREVILRRDEYLCQESKRYGKRVQANTVHHIYPVEFYPELTYVNWNLISLSDSRHNEMHDRITHEITDKGKRLQERRKKEFEEWEKNKKVYPRLI